MSNISTETFSCPRISFDDKYMNIDPPESCFYSTDLYGSDLIKFNTDNEGTVKIPLYGLIYIRCAYCDKKSLYPVSELPNFAFIASKVKRLKNINQNGYHLYLGCLQHCFLYLY